MPHTPQHSVYKPDNFIYPDDSGFMFDLPPVDVLSNPNTWDEGEIYSVPVLPRFRADGHWMGWTMWAERWQKDYRFTAVSDYNARATYFPEVHDPWMFTEYLFEGTGMASGLPGAAAVAHNSIEPPLVNPLIRGQVDDEPTLTYLNSQVATYSKGHDLPLYTLESLWESDETGERWWESELAALKWSEELPGGSINTKFHRLQVQRRVVLEAGKSLNDGVRVYRNQVWSESTRWGASQNIPGRVINMTGPKDYYRPTGVFTGKIVPRVTVQIGTPVYDNLTQSATGQQACFLANGMPGEGEVWSNQARISLATVTPVGTNGDPAATFTYAAPPALTIDDGVPIRLPQVEVGDVANYRVTENSYSNGDLVHRGCAFWVGEDGSAHCKYWSQNESSFTANPDIARPYPVPNLCALCNGNTQQSRVAYKAAGGQCPYYTPQGIRTVLAYTGEAREQQELWRMQRVMHTPALGTAGLPGIGGVVAGGIFQYGPPNPITEVSDANEGFAQKRISVTYEPEIVGVDGRQTFYDTFDGKPRENNPENDLRIKPGTGMFPLDEKANEPFAGVDTPMFGFVNQINYRVMQNTMHCYKASRCDNIITTRTIAPGFVRGRFSGVNFTSHALRMPGYPARDGTDTQCHYGDGFCPYNRLDRRAVEYNENYKILLKEILMPFRMSGIHGFAGSGLTEALLLNGQLLFLTEETYVPETHETGMWCAVRAETAAAPPVIGHYQPVLTGYRIFFFYDRPSWDPNHMRSHVAAHIVQFDDDNNPLYMTIPAEYQAGFTTVYGNAAQVPWLTELVDEYKEPKGNLLMVTNALPFWGGRSPEYKDHTKRGRQVKCKWGYESAGSFTSGNQFGGWQNARTPSGKAVTIGYWTDANGDWIIKETGTDVQPAVNYTDPWCVPVDARIRNKPAVTNGAWPIDGVPGLFFNSPDNPQINRDSEYASVGATYSNDTEELLQWFRAPVLDEFGQPATYLDKNGNERIETNWHSLLPVDPLSTTEPPQKVQVAPPNVSRWTPPERYKFRCDVCGIVTPEEHANYLAAITAFEAERGGKCKCPRQDGGELFEDGAMAHIHSSCARGFVDVWGPPGSTVRHDAFFWKQPTLVTRALETQMSHKLGAYNSTGGGYTFDSLTPDVEKPGRLPTPEPNHYYPQLNHQVTVPWARPGDTVLTVRNRVRDWFGLDLYATPGTSDAAFLVRYGQPGETRIPIADEGTFVLQVNDLLHFARVYPTYRRQLGLVIAVANDLPATLMNEFLVKNDRPQPVVENYPATEDGIALFQHHLREWLLNGVDGTYAQWATATTMVPNLFSAKMEAENKNPDLGKPYHPGDPPGSSHIGRGAGPKDIDERVIAAYSRDEFGGLHMITRTQFQRMRNRVTPMLAYDLSTESRMYSAGGDYTNMAQASNTNRFSTTNRDVPGFVFGTIPPQIMAANDTGRDSYVEWENEDSLLGLERAFYPVGTTWWRMNQRIGHICRNNGTNPLHMDCDPDAVLPNTYQYYLSRGYEEYTGDNIVSTVTYFLHGHLPMDKEVIRAFLVVDSIDDGPTAGALGCKGKYTGYEGLADISHYQQTGLLQMAEGTGEYRGNAECFFQHFHPWTTTHEGDVGSYQMGSLQSFWGSPGYAGIDSKNHWDVGPVEDGTVPWQASSDGPNAVPMYRNDRSGFENMDWLWRPAQDETMFYNHSVDIFGMRYVDDTYGFGVFQWYLAQGRPWGQDLIQVVPEETVWKELTRGEYDTALATYSTQCLITVNSVGGTLTFPYTAQAFRRKIFARQHQGVPGWFDFSGYNTSGRFKDDIDYATVVEDESWGAGPQVIVQAAGSPISDGGGNGNDNSGNIPRVVDVTSLLQNQYNKRVARYYKCVLGVAFTEFWSHFKGQWDAIDYTIEYPPLWWWNYRHWSTNHGMWITDPWHMPTVSNDQAMEPDGDGQPLPSSTASRAKRVESCTGWDTQGLTDQDPDYYQYHPISLTLATAGDEFCTDQSTPGVYPVPEQPATRYWRNISTSVATSAFTMDLRQQPYELERRPWRYQMPSINASNATCPNVNGCWVAEQGLTVGELNEQGLHNVWRPSAPSMSSIHCSICGTPLEGVVYTDGDNILTVDYDAAREPNCVITAIEVSLATNDNWNEDLTHGFVIEYYNTEILQWRELVSVTVDTATGLFRYKQSVGTAWQWVETADLPDMLIGTPCDHHGNPVTATNGAHFPVVAAQKIRFKVTRPALVLRTDPVAGYSNFTSTADPTVIHVDNLIERPDTYVGHAIELVDVSDGNAKAAEIVKVEEDDPSGYLLTLNTSIDGRVRYKISWDDYIARCSTFRVYGYPYQKGEVVISPPAPSEQFFFSNGNSTFRLSTYPSQIARVDVIAGDDPGIVMTEATTLGSDFAWGVEKVDYNGQIFLRIVTGKWYYSCDTNTIEFPGVYIDPDNPALRHSVWTINEDLYTSASPLMIDTRPSSVRIEYLIGLGVPCTVSIDPYGEGPSYQLDRECVCFVANNTSDAGEVYPPDILSDPLPSLGDSVQLKALNGRRYPLEWRCYNHQPIIWDRDMDWVYGNELPAGGWDDTSVMNLWTGNHGFDVSDLGPAAVIRGKANGEVTLYGAPNTILSGNLAVYAKAYTTRQYHTREGLVTTFERTGGYKEGAVVVRLTVNETVENGRKSISAGVPRLLVYMKERDILKPV